MSLLMQALKKAEQAKKQTPQSAEGQADAAAYPTLDDVLPAPSEPAPIEEMAFAREEKHELELSLTEPEIRVEPTMEAAKLSVSEPESVVNTEIEPKTEPKIEPKLEPRQPVTMQELVTPPARPAPPTIDQAIQSQHLAQNVFAAKKPGHQRRTFLLVWVGLLIAILGAGAYYVHLQLDQIESADSGAKFKGRITPIATARPDVAQPATAPSASPTQEKNGATSKADKASNHVAINSAGHTRPARDKAMAASTNDHVVHVDPTTGTRADQIQVLKSQIPAQIHATLTNAYNLFNAGNISAAQPLYDAVLRQEPNNRDALLGSAAIALISHQQEKAAQLYSRLLDLDPTDPDAIAGLTSLRRADPDQSESQLKNVLARNPDSGTTLFELGNLYSQQSRWSEAEDAYFRAFTATPDNADYAFNLAVSLDRLGQQKLALNYYQRALTLTQFAPGVFNAAAARTRVDQLQKTLK